MSPSASIREIVKDEREIQARVWIKRGPLRIQTSSRHNFLVASNNGCRALHPSEILLMDEAFSAARSAAR